MVLLRPGYNPLTPKFTLRRKSWLKQKLFTPPDLPWTEDPRLTGASSTWGLITPDMSGAKTQKTAEKAGKTAATG